MAERRSRLDRPLDRSEDSLRVRRALEAAGDGPALQADDAERLAARVMARASAVRAQARTAADDDWASLVLAVGRPLLPRLLASTLVLATAGAWTLAGWSDSWPLSATALGEIAQLAEAVAP